MSEVVRPPRLQLGKVYLTPAACEALVRTDTEFMTLLTRHQSGDWGDLDAHDRKVNEEQLRSCGRVLSSYALCDGTVIWVITEAGWGTTTALVREEY